LPGAHKITLGVSSEQCPLHVQTLTKKLKVETPAEAKRYPVSFVLRNIPLFVEARNIGLTAYWHTPVNLSDSGIYNPRFTGFADMKYTITLTIEGGCETLDTLLVQIVEKADIMVPTAFTPNRDGLNDFLKPILMGVKELRYFRIFNRWGELVYFTNQSNPGWDGTFKGNLQPSQTFVWMTEGISISGEIITKKGTAILVR
jgi:gliding motility-associated-like protein